MVECKTPTIRSSLIAQPLGGLAPNGVPPVARQPHEGFITFRISRRGTKYLETAQTLLRAAKTMTDAAIAGQLKALAEDYQRQAERASHVDATKAWLGPPLAPNASGVHDLTDSTQ